MVYSMKSLVNKLIFRLTVKWNEVLEFKLWCSFYQCERQNAVISPFIVPGDANLKQKIASSEININIQSSFTYR